MANRKVKCVFCGSPEAYRYDLMVRPAVYGCDSCSSLFTKAGGRERGPSPRQVRRILVQRWRQLAADAEFLADAIRRAPPRAFSASERQDLIYELEGTLWDALVNNGPTLDPTRLRQRPPTERKQ